MLTRVRLQQIEFIKCYFAESKWEKPADFVSSWEKNAVSIDSVSEILLSVDNVSEPPVSIDTITEPPALSDSVLEPPSSLDIDSVSLKCVGTATDLLSSQKVFKLNAICIR